MISPESYTCSSISLQGAPLYISEISPPNLRGTLLVLESISVVSGVVIAYWITFGTRLIESEVSFRLPFGLAEHLQSTYLETNHRWLRCGILPAIPRNKCIHLLRSDTIRIDRSNWRYVFGSLGSFQLPSAGHCYRLLLYHRQSWSSTTGHLRWLWHLCVLYCHRRFICSLWAGLVCKYSGRLGMRCYDVPVHSHFWSLLLASRMDAALGSLSQRDSLQGCRLVYMCQLAV